MRFKCQVWKKWSDRKIAEHIGVTQQYISKIKSQLTTSCKLPDRSIIECKDGRIRNTAAIGKSQGIKKQDGGKSIWKGNWGNIRR